MVVAHSGYGDGSWQRRMVCNAGSRRLPVGHRLPATYRRADATPHIGTDKPEGMRSHLSKTAMLALAVTIHNLPEGMAVGVVFAGAENGAPHISLAATISVSLGIAIQNIPEGAIISMPKRAAGNSRWRSFVLGSLSRVVEPIGAMPYCCLPHSLCTPYPTCSPLQLAPCSMWWWRSWYLKPQAASTATSAP